jgi:dethiobiotin synthetase
VDAKLLRSGIEFWRERSEVVVVEGAGGLLSPVTEKQSVADLAEVFGYPLVVVVPNRIGAINSCLLTLTAAAARGKALPVAAVVLNDVLPPGVDDPSTASNLRELKKRCEPPVFSLKHGGEQIEGRKDWLSLAF